MNKQGFVYIFVLSAILALSLICIQTMELFSVELRAAAHKRQTIEQLYLLETGLAQGKALVLKHSPDLGFEKSFAPSPGLNITITDESAKLSPFFLKEGDSKKDKTCAMIFSKLTKNSGLTQKLTKLAQTHNAVNSKRRKSTQPVLFPQTLDSLLDEEHPAQDSDQFLTTIETNGININTAPRPVLDALFENPSISGAIINARKNKKIKNREELKKILSLKKLPATGTIKIRFDSQFYRILVRTQAANINTKEVLLYVELVRAEEGQLLARELFCEEIKPGKD